MCSANARHNSQLPRLASRSTPARRSRALHSTLTDRMRVRTLAPRSHVMHTNCHAHASHDLTDSASQHAATPHRLRRRRWSCARGMVDERGGGSCDEPVRSHRSARYVTTRRNATPHRRAPRGFASLAVIGSSFTMAAVAPRLTRAGGRGHGGRPRANLENPTRSFTLLGLAVTTVHSDRPGATPTGFT